MKQCLEIRSENRFVSVSQSRRDFDLWPVVGFYQELFGSSFWSRYFFEVMSPHSRAQHLTCMGMVLLWRRTFQHCRQHCFSHYVIVTNNWGLDYMFWMFWMFFWFLFFSFSFCVWKKDSVYETIATHWSQRQIYARDRCAHSTSFSVSHLLHHPIKTHLDFTVFKHQFPSNHRGIVFNLLCSRSLCLSLLKSHLLYVLLWNIVACLSLLRPVHFWLFEVLLHNVIK